MADAQINASKKDNFYCITAFVYIEIHPIIR